MMKFKVRAFTLVELLSSIVILAIVATVALMFTGNYIQSAKYESDHQTLVVLNDALTRYKTQGGNLSALTAGKPIDNMIAALQTPVNWAGMSHQFLKGTDNYLAASIDAAGSGAQYRFTRYDTYGEVVTWDDSAQAQSYGSYAAWETDALAAVGSGNSLTITNPSSTTTIQLDVRVGNQGDEVWVWGDDGTASAVYTPLTGSNTAITHTYGSSANRTIVIYGDISRLESTYSDGRSDFAFDVSTVPNTLTYLDVRGTNTLSGSVAGLTNLTYLQVQGANTLSGSIAGLTGLTHLCVQGSNTVSGSVAGLTNLTYLDVQGGNTVSGSLAGLTGLTYLTVDGSNTVSGSISGLTQLTWLRATGSNTLSGSVAGLTSLTFIYIAGSNTISGDISGLTGITFLSAYGNNTISGDIGGLTNLTFLRPQGNNTVTGSVANLPLQLIYVGGSSTIDVPSMVAATGTKTGLSYFYLTGGYTVNQTQVDTILVNMNANKDETKPRSERRIKMTDPSHAAPSATG